MSHSFRLSRRAFAAWAGLGTLATVTGVRAQAGFPQPGRPIRLLVGLAAGGSLDGQARAIGSGWRRSPAPRWWWTTNPAPA